SAPLTIARATFKSVSCVPVSFSAFLRKEMTFLRAFFKIFTTFLGGAVLAAALSSFALPWSSSFCRLVRPFSVTLSSANSVLSVLIRQVTDGKLSAWCCTHPSVMLQVGVVHRSPSSHSGTFAASRSWWEHPDSASQVSEVQGFPSSH